MQPCSFSRISIYSIIKSHVKVFNQVSQIRSQKVIHQRIALAFWKVNYDVKIPPPSVGVFKLVTDQKKGPDIGLKPELFLASLDELVHTCSLFFGTHEVLELLKRGLYVGPPPSVSS